MRITLGGFIENHPEGGKLEGVCEPDHTRNILDCDIYNGLADWTVTEIILRVDWKPYEAQNVRDYSTRVSIASLTTQNLSIRLGLHLPADDRIRHWHWIIARAKGYRVK